jgi:Phytochelatin synthase
MRVHLDPTGGSPPRDLVRIQILTLTACLLCGLAETSALAQAQKESTPKEPVYLDSAEGLKRLEESDARQSFVPLSMYFVTQETQTFCGVASSTMVLNALVPKDQRAIVYEWKPYRLFAQSVFFTCEVEKIAPRNDVLDRGMTLEQLGKALGTSPVNVDVFHAGGKNDEDVFRNKAKEVLRSHDSFLIVNFDRKKVGQVGGGHFSPIAAYHEPTDSLLVYDVARYKYPPSWVRTKDLWNAMNTTDSDSKKNRGYLIVSKSAH